jgi:hypothetical protein
MTIRYKCKCGSTRLTVRVEYDVKLLQCNGTHPWPTPTAGSLQVGDAPTWGGHSEMSCLDCSACGPADSFYIANKEAA